MDALNDPAVDTVVVMSSAQVGKTEILNNIVGYFIDQDPCPMLVLQPTLEMAETWSKDRLAPMLRDTPALRDRVSDPSSRSTSNSIKHKEFPGGHITMAGANSPASLASRPIRIVACDEVDRYPASAGTEGDPISLAFKRTTTFWNRKRILTSTPTIKGVSRIEAAFDGSTMEHYQVPCPSCGERQALKWSSVKWEKDDPDSARYECEHCGEAWSDAERWAALQWGEWVADKPGASVRGFHLSELYSPWVQIAEIVEAFLKAKKLPETLKTWINTSLGETWEEQGETVEPDVLYRQRREQYGDALPAEALVVTAGIDQQKGWLAFEAVAWSTELESWSLEYRVIHGDTSDHRRGAWADLKAYLRAARYPHESGAELRIDAAAVDTHGSYTSAAYKFCKSLSRSRVYAVRGKGGMGLPVVAAVSRNNDEKVTLFTLGVDTLKSRLYSRLYEIEEPGPGYCHFPVDYDEPYFEGLASEKAVTKYRQGRAEVAWIPKPGTRQEPLDVRVYAMAALEILGPKWSAFRRRAAVSRTSEPASSPDEPTAPSAARRGGGRRRRSGNWVTRW